MPTDPPDDPHAGMTPIDGPVLSEPGQYDYVEAIERDALYGEADFSTYSDAELAALRDELAVSAPEAATAIRDELAERRRVDEPPVDDAVERAGDSTVGHADAHGDDGSAERGEEPRADDDPEADGYVSGYEAGYDDGYEAGYEE